MRNLERALTSLTDSDPSAPTLARVLASACHSGTLMYEEVEALAGDDTEDVLLLGWEWKLLIPIRTLRCGEWDDRVLMAKPGETYEVPNVSRLLIEDAHQNGEWNPQRAIATFFRMNGEAEWKKMPGLVAVMIELCSNAIITAAQIASACQAVGLEGRIDTMIAILKGAGVMSPKLGSLSEVARNGAPLYELNPGLFSQFDNSRKNVYLVHRKQMDCWG